MLARYISFVIAATVLLGAAPRPSDTLHWRNIGPFRGGRTASITGVAGHPGVFYMAPTDGGVWKSTDYGRTWNPVFDGQDTGSIGALAVSQSDPRIVYAASGEGLRRPDLSVGDGIYKSSDGGATWTHLGLRDAQQINGLAVDPRDPNRVFAAAMGHPYGANAQRGLYRSTDGGATWTKVLGPNDGDTGAATVVIDPNHPDTVYANLWAARNPPWRLSDSLQIYQNGGVYKSIDGGTTWTKLHGGLPAAMGRVGISVSKADSNVVYAWVNEAEKCGIYRTDDAGATWHVQNTEDRICGRGGDFAGIGADPQDVNTVYVTNTTTYRSTNGGKTFTGIKGAPGGDDYHQVWIDPSNHDVIALAVDQGATISVNHGQTWSSWYNQPTAQFYHVVTDNRFPYWVMGGQQESGSAEVASRSDDGSIWLRYWHPAGAEEYAYVAPDPLHPYLIYGAGAGHVTRYDERTSQTATVSPAFGGRFKVGDLRYNRTNPLVFSTVDKHALYFGSSVVFETRDGGVHWRRISADLTRVHPGVPANIGNFKKSPLAAEERGVVYSIAPSYTDSRVVWAGTDDGLVWVTRDGGARWSNVTPPGMTAWSKVTQIDSSHFDRGSAYVSVSRFRLDDLHPYIYKTHDFGAHWTRITNGLPADSPANTVREDTVRRGLLFAGTERTVYVSFNDGGSWESLQRDLPSTSIRDLVVHGNDIVVGTHGRSFWILDDISPLRQYRGLASTPSLVKPASAYRLRRDTWSDTPLPPEEPAGENPPTGAILDYYLPREARSVQIDVLDASGSLVRRYRNTDAAPPIDPEITVPTYWVGLPKSPSAAAGMHRFVWDGRYAKPLAVGYDYPISAIPHDTPLVPEGILALPGQYTVRLTVDGKTVSQPLHLLMDPRVAVSTATLRSQYQLASRIVGLMNRTYAKAKTNRRYAGFNARLGALLDTVESADTAPTPAMQAAVSAIEGQIH
ncbi:MAG TPA: hypothetical protein VFL13_11765 [Candidatus Baltobacteraceae bacterium]|nr:hypothetical protein [Candidatus Baltobacteraceae bacterium]